MKPFALAGPPHTDGVERTSRANVPGKSELQIGEIGSFAPARDSKVDFRRTGAKRCRTAKGVGSFGFGRTVPGREFKACEHTETTRPVSRAGASRFAICTSTEGFGERRPPGWGGSTADIQE